MIIDERKDLCAECSQVDFGVIVCDGCGSFFCADCEEKEKIVMCESCEGYFCENCRASLWSSFCDECQDSSDSI